MLKKMVVIAAVLMLVAPAFGAWSRVQDVNQTNPNLAGGDTVDWEKDGNNWQRKAEVWNWPSEYNYLPICEMPVEMEVGFFIKVQDCGKTLKLKQVKINEYTGKQECTAFTNVATQWKAAFSKTLDALSGGNSVTVSPNAFGPAPTGQKLTVNLTLTGVDVAKLPIPEGTQRCLRIGKVTLSVRPNVSPNSFMAGGCSGETWPTIPANW